MNCPSCKKEVVADRFFCTWCEVFMPSPSAGTKAGLFRRWFATAIDPLLAIVLYFVIAVPFVGIFAGIESSAGSSGGGTFLAIVDSPLTKTDPFSLTKTDPVAATGFSEGVAA